MRVWRMRAHAPHVHISGMISKWFKSFFRALEAEWGHVRARISFQGHVFLRATHARTCSARSQLCSLWAASNSKTIWWLWETEWNLMRAMRACARMVFQGHARACAARSQLWFWHSNVPITCLCGSTMVFLGRPNYLTRKSCRNLCTSNSHFLAAKWHKVTENLTFWMAQGRTLEKINKNYKPLWVDCFLNQ